MLRMSQVHVIRHKLFAEGKSIRAVAREMGVSRNTVRKYKAESEPKRRESGRRPRPVLDRVAARIDELLELWRGRTTAKQRITGSRIHRQLVEEGHQIGITTVRTYLRELRRQAAETFIPLVWRAGDAAQADFFEVTVRVGGETVKAWKFLLRLMHSERDFAWIYRRADQLAFLDGHVRAFAHWGGIPARIVYDRLSAAVKNKVGLAPELTDRFRALSSHCLFEPCFARPGEGHDKGGVESRGKAVRLQHLTPVPEGESLEEINRRLLHDLDEALARKVARSAESEERHRREKSLLRPLPETPFEARRLELAQVSRQAFVRIGGADYSVPSHWKRLTAEAWVGVDDIRISCRGETVVRKTRPKGSRNVRWRHYLPELARKPQAVRQVAPELTAELGPPYGRLWRALSETHGELKGARAFAGLLAAVVRLGEEPVREAVAQALDAGRCDLADLGRRLYPRRARSAEVPEKLRGHTVQSGRASDYDWLLKGGSHV